MAVKSLSRSTLLSTGSTNSLLGDFSNDGYELIQTVSASATVGSITLSGDWSKYKHLQIRTSFLISGNQGGSVNAIQFNGDGASNYSYHSATYYGYSMGVNYSSSATSAIVHYHISTSSSEPSCMIIDVLDINSTNKTKSLKVHSGSLSVDATMRAGVYFGSASWRNASSPITSFTISNASTLLAGSRISLYGIKA